MAKKRWAVRENAIRTGWYMLFVGAKPRKPREDTEGWDSDQAGFLGFVCPEMFKKFCPKRYHLKPGGGPVLIEFKDEE